MPDDVVDLTFSNDVMTDSVGNTATVNGTIQIDYTNSTVAANYTVKSTSPSNSFNNSNQFSGTGALTNNNNGTFTYSNSGLQVTFSGEAPTTGSFFYTETINEFTVNPDGTITQVPVTVDTFSSANNAGGATAQPIKSAVISTACYASYTQIRTATGEVAVQNLNIGDLVISAISGKARPIRWLGHRTIDCRHHVRPDEVMPVRITANAFGISHPSRDLYVSPGHAICVDVLGEVLIPAGLLVNGSTIQQVEIDAVTYWHVELETHDVILAENLPAESYLDMANRSFFEEAGVVALVACPDCDPAQRTHADFCLPYVDRGPLLDAVRAQLTARAAALAAGEDRQAA